MKEKDRWFFKDPPRQKKNELINTLGNNLTTGGKSKKQSQFQVTGVNCQYVHHKKNSNFQDWDL